VGAILAKEFTLQYIALNHFKLKRHAGFTQYIGNVSFKPPDFDPYEPKLPILGCRLTLYRGPFDGVFVECVGDAAGLGFSRRVRRGALREVWAPCDGSGCRGVLPTLSLGG
jgi:hypothetical protein